MRYVLVTISLFCVSLMSFGQEATPISTTTYIGCGGFLLDTGLAPNDYASNESFTMTLCAEAPETILNLYWNSFNLGTGDEMTIYDGSDITAPLIGTFTEIDLQTTDITSSVDGCLTLVWTSDDADTGNFSAEIACGPPCQRPIAAVDIPSDLPWRICVGEEITLDATPTVFAGGASLGSHTWDFDDETIDNTSWPTVTHSYDTSGAYVIQLFVVDDNNCNSGNTIDVLVEVSTAPSFFGTTQDIIICPGVEVEIGGVVTPTEWTGAISSDFGGALFIPDDQSQCFSSEILVSDFTADQEVTQTSDLEHFLINFEHSYMGDLTLTFICPNGQSLLVHANGGEGTYLGEPIQDDYQPDAEGVGYDYYWAPDATNGTWTEEAGGNQTLPPGTYASESPWENLIGCPLNGVWTIEICDNLSSDNGFIFDWTVAFDPSLYEEDLSFTPSIGVICDSTYWTTTEVIPIQSDTNCDTITATFSDTGDYLFTYTAVDNHGCEYTEDVTVYVSDISIIGTPAISPVCPGQGVFISSEVQSSHGDVELLDLWYIWESPAGVLSEGAFNAWVDIAPPGIDETTTYTVTVFPVGLPECATTDEVTIEVSTILVSIDGGGSTCPNLTEQLQGNVSFSGAELGYLGYEWSPPNLLSDASILNPTITGIDEEITLTLSVSQYGDCESTADVTFTLLPAPSSEVGSTEWCPSQNSILSAFTDGTVDSLNWQNLDTGLYYGTSEQTVVPEGGTYLLTVFGCGQTSTNTVFVESRSCDIFIPNVFTPDGDSEGLNNAFRMIGIEYQSNAHLLVFNRWGTIVFEDTNYKGDWAPDKDELSDGVYFYILKLSNGEEKNGTVTVLRK